VVRRVLSGPALAVALWLGVTVTLALLAALGHPALPGELAPTNAGARHLVDFRDTVWVPVRDLLSGHDPYDPLPYLARHPGSQELDLYAPWALLLGAPFAALPFALAGGLWVLAQGACAAGAAVLLSRRAGGGPGVGFLIAAGAELLQPSRSTLLPGQWTFLLALGLALVIDHRPVLAGLGLVLLLTKPQTGLVVLAVVLVARGWPLLRRGAVWALALGGLPLLLAVIPAGGPVPLLGALRRNLDYSTGTETTSTTTDLDGRVDALGTVERLAGHIIGGPPGLLLTLGPLLLVLTAVLVSRTRWDRLAASPAWVAALAAAALLALPHRYYDLALLLVPTALALVARGTEVGARLVLVVTAAAPLVHPRRLDAPLAGHPVSGSASTSVDAVLLLLPLCAGLLLALSQRRGRDRLVAPGLARTTAPRPPARVGAG